MAATNGYCTTQDLKDYIGDQITGAKWEAMLDDCVTSASRLIDQECGRRFYADSAATARKYWPDDATVVGVDDISTTSSLVVAYDSGDDGTYETTVTSTDYQTEPVNGVEGGVSGWPITRIRLVESVTFPTIGKRPTVSVTAKWGWLAVPDAIEHACKILAAQLFVLKDAPGGVMGFGAEGFAVRIRSIPPQVDQLLLPYRKSTQIAMVF